MFGSVRPVGLEGSGGSRPTAPATASNNYSNPTRACPYTNLKGQGPLLQTKMEGSGSVMFHPCAQCAMHTPSWTCSTLAWQGDAVRVAKDRLR